MNGGGLVAHLARVTMGRRWRSYAGVALLIGLTLGLSLFALAGARRTQSSYPQFLDAVDAATMSIADGSQYDPDEIARIASFPEVTGSRAWVGLNTGVLDDDGVDPRAQPLLEPVGTFDGEYFEQNRFTATSGRMADPDALDEAVVNEYAAEQLGYALGDELELGLWPFEDFLAVTADSGPPPAERRTVKIVGIGQFPDEVLQDETDRLPRLLVTPAFTAAAADYVSYRVQALTLENGAADVTAVKERLAETYPPGALIYRVTQVDTHHALRATRPLSVSLGVFGAVIGIAGLVLSAQAIGRVLRAERLEREVLRAFGAAPRSIVLRALTGPALAILAGAGLAVVLAVVGSPLMPLGPTRDLGVGRGIDVDLAVLGLGAAAIVVVLGAAATVAAWWDTRRLGQRSRIATRTSRVADVASSGGLSPAAGMGIRWALQASAGDEVVQTRSVAVGAAVAAAAVTAALVFGASLRHLVDDPHLYGWDWDAVVIAGSGYDNLPPADTEAAIARVPDVDAWSGAHFGSDPIDGRETPLIGLEPGSDVVPPLVEGRPVAADDEVVLGLTTADSLGVGVGDTVSLGSRGAARELEVVGVGVLPTLGVIHAARTSLGVGAVVAPELVPGSDLDVTLAEGDDLGPNAALVRFTPGTDAEAGIDRLREATRSLVTFTGLDVRGVQRPAEIVNSDSLGTVPVFLAAALVAGALTSLALALGTSVRRRQRELALVKTLGFSRRQLASTVVWQATATVVIGLVVGIPVGVAAGRLAWAQFADQLDVLAEPVTPLLGLGAVLVGAVVVANGAAWLPSRRARRVSASAVLAQE